MADIIETPAEGDVKRDLRRNLADDVQALRDILSGPANTVMRLSHNQQRLAAVMLRNLLRTAQID